MSAMGRRIGAIVLRYLFLYRRSIARMGEIVFWPVMNLLVWGFTTVYLQRVAVPSAVVFLIGAIIFWDLFYRAQQSITLSIGEDIWVRNILNLFIAPISVPELITAICIFGIIKTLMTTFILAVLAFVLYAFNLWTMGWALLPFFAILLLFGWAVGLVTMGLSLRYGYAAEALIWGMPFLLQPISAVFYPIDVLPRGLQSIAVLLPSTYVFEGMRQVLQEATFSVNTLVRAFGLNLVYLVLGGVFFGWMLRQVREKGLLTHLTLE